MTPAAIRGLTVPSVENRPAPAANTLNGENRNMTTTRSTICLLALALAATAARAEIVVKNGEQIAFLGDSITAQGWSSPHGYVKLVVAGLESCGVNILPLPAGVGGNRSSDMLARLKRDVLDKKPNWVTISCGMNDVIHGEKGIPLDDYKKNMAAIVDQCQQAGIKTLILTTTLAGKWDSEASKKLGDYSAALRELARAKTCPVVDLYPVFQGTAKTSDALHGLTYDGVHMSPEGNILIAKTLLQALGCTEPQIATAYEKWLDIPNAGGFSARVDVVMNKRFFHVTCNATLREREQLLAAAKAAGRPTLMHWSKELLASLMKKKLKPTGPFNSLDEIFDQGKDKQVQEDLQREFEQAIRKIAAGK